MIAKKEWFKPRILGWGLRPVTWEGWVYVAIVILLFLGALNLPIDDLYKVILAGIVMVVFLVDSLVVMFQMYKKLDEREKKHQQIIETSSSYVAVTALVVLMLYRAYLTDIIDYGLITVLLVMVVAKAVASVYLMKKK